MFGKKKPTPEPTPFKLQALTTEYLIEGQAEGGTQLYIPHGEEWDPIHLSAVQITVTGQQDMPLRTASEFWVQGDDLVAIIPHKAASEMDQYDVWENYTERREGLFYVGPYLILGAMMFIDDAVLEAAMPMVDVTIRHRLPNAAMKQLSAPFILVSTKWLSGYEPT
jgi:hypothetical protein